MQEALDHKAALFSSIIKVGRTHAQDATPLTLGQEFSGYAAQASMPVTEIVHDLNTNKA